MFRILSPRPQHSVSRWWLTAFLQHETKSSWQSAGPRAQTNYFDVHEIGKLTNECRQMLSHYSRLLFTARPAFALPDISFYCSASYSARQNYTTAMCPYTCNALALVRHNNHCKRNAQIDSWASKWMALYRAVVRELCSVETLPNEEI
jgi:hypothetical protein